jgi:hypothetical protein
MSQELPPDHRCECADCQAGTNAALCQQHVQINLFLSRLTEPQRRWYVGLLSQAPDAPTDRQLTLITGLARSTIQRGREELDRGLVDVPGGPQRRLGAGRPPAEKKIRR